jgi:MFS family permease
MTQDHRGAAGAARTSGPETVVVHGADVHVERAHFELPLAEARSRYGGTSVPAVLAGALAGLGTASLLGGLASAVGLQVGQVTDEAARATEFAVGGAVTAVVVLALSALVGGWVAGRVARFDGARNGLLAGLVLALLVGLLGAVVTAAHAGALSPLASDGGLTTAAVAAALVGLAVSLLAGLAGGRLGARWHRDVDDVLLGTRPGSVERTSSTGGLR